MDSSSSYPTDTQASSQNDENWMSAMEERESQRQRQQSLAQQHHSQRENLRKIRDDTLQVAQSQYDEIAREEEGRKQKEEEERRRKERQRNEEREQERKKREKMEQTITFDHNMYVHFCILIHWIDSHISKYCVDLIGIQM